VRAFVFGRFAAGRFVLGSSFLALVLGVLFLVFLRNEFISSSWFELIPPVRLILRSA